MTATVINIKHPNDYESPRINVTVRGREYGLDTWKRPELYDQLRVGDTVEVKRQTNNPYMVPVV